MQFIMDALQWISDSFGNILDFIKGIPAFIIEIFVYIKAWLFIKELEFQIWLIEISYEAARNILQDYEVYNVLNSAFNQLPDDLRYISYQLGIVDAVRITIDAMATAFVLRIIGW